MLRLIASGNALPFSFPVDDGVEFRPGMLAQLTVIGNQVLATVSNGTAPIGIIDDIKTRSFLSTAWDETIVVSATGVPGPGGSIITPIDIRTELANPNIVPKSFSSLFVTCKLVPRNGVIVFPAGTALNYDLAGTGVPNAIKTLVRYQFQIPNIIGDDTTFASKQMTVWFMRMILETDQFDTSQVYPVNANLFCGEDGQFTSAEPFPNAPSIAIVTAPPSSILGTLQVLWL